MGELNLNINVERADKVAPALERGLHEGLFESGEWMMDEGEDKAKDVVMSTERIWLKRVKQGFSTEENQFSRSNHWKGHIKNSATHAEIVEKGLAPKGEIEGASPSVQDILPWVDDKVVPNTRAQQKAQSANIENWDPDLASAAEEYGTANVIAAFAIAEGLEEEGYAGVGFMETAEQYLKQVGPRLVKQKVEKHMRRELRAAGVS